MPWADLIPPREPVSLQAKLGSHPNPPHRVSWGWMKYSKLAPVDWYQTLQLGMVIHTCNPALIKLKQEDRCAIILGYP